MIKSSPHEALVRARIAVDQVRLSRLATQNAIERNRQSLAEMKAILVALRDAILIRITHESSEADQRHEAAPGELAQERGGDSE